MGWVGGWGLGGWLWAAGADGADPWVGLMINAGGSGVGRVGVDGQDWAAATDEGVRLMIDAGVNVGLGLGVGVGLVCCAGGWQQGESSTWRRVACGGQPHACTAAASGRVPLP